jgi:hypothetical protein
MPVLDGFRATELMREWEQVQESLGEEFLLACDALREAAATAADFRRFA